jgi:hypothetical protein
MAYQVAWELTLAEDAQSHTPLPPCLRELCPLRGVATHALWPYDWLRTPCNWTTWVSIQVPLLPSYLSTDRPLDLSGSAFCFVFIYEVGITLTS